MPTNINNMVFSISKKRIRKSYKKQLKEGWTLFSEREILENSLNQRVNYIVAVFALFVTAAASVENKKNLIIVFFVGSLFLLLLTITTFRVATRLDVTLKMIYKLNRYQAPILINKELKYHELFRLGPMVKTIYQYIPVFCTVVMAFGLFATILGWLEPGKGGETINNVFN